MKVELSKQPERTQKIPYPKLMMGQGTGKIVLFTHPKVGTVVYKGEGSIECGVHSEDWNMDYYTDLDPEIKVILQND